MTNSEIYLRYLIGDYEGELPYPRPVRHEIYLATICGVEHNYEIPEPVTREDIYLRQLALNGPGSGPGENTCDCEEQNQRLEMRIEGRDYWEPVVEADPAFKEVTTWEDLLAEMEVKYAGYDYSEVVVTTTSSDDLSDDGIGTSMSVSVPLYMWDKEAFEGWDYYRLEALMAPNPDTLKNNVTKTIDAFDAIQEVLESKGIEVSDIHTREYAGLIDTLSSGEASDVSISDASYLFYEGARTDNIDYLLSMCKDLTSCAYMFRGCRNVESVDLTGLDTSQVTDMSFAFSFGQNGNTSAITEIIGLSELNTSSVSLFNSLFGDNTGWIRDISEVDLSKWDTSSANNMTYMFYGLRYANIKGFENFNTSSVSSFSYMFQYNEVLQTVDLGNWDFSSLTASSGLRSMFDKCTQLREVTNFLANNEAAYVSLRATFPVGTASSPSAFQRLVFHESCQAGGFSYFDLSYCSFNRENMRALFESLPTATHATESYRTITITGNPCVSGAAGYDQLTDEDKQIALDKNWVLAI